MIGNQKASMATLMLQDQSDVIALLSDADSYAPRPDAVTVIETHGAMVFLAGGEAYKIKKPVRFSYMDFSTLEKRHRICAREVALNRAFAPDLYRGLVAVTREADGRLTLDGAGEPVEWAVHMKRFDQDQLLSAVAARDGLDTGLMVRLADAVAASHGRVPETRVDRADVRIEAVVRQLSDFFSASDSADDRFDTEAFRARLGEHLEAARYGLKLRGRRGFVRRCHGDLHLGNIVALDGQPVLFDALEFNEDMATIDTLYDLAFLLMDLDERGLRQQANIVLNRYLARTGELIDLFGLCTLPLLLACRAGIRALVLLTRAGQTAGPEQAGKHAAARRYLDAALGYLEPAPARLIAIGGLSGTGKTTLACALAPAVGAAPGAVVLRSDVERKAMHGVEETERLGPEAYERPVSVKVFDALCQKAHTVLKAGHSVVVDAVYLRATERAAIEQVAERTGVAFQGLWLNAARDVMVERVANRTGDASDATPEIVDLQVTLGTGPVAWLPVNAGGDPASTLEQAKKVLGVE